MLSSSPILNHLHYTQLSGAPISKFYSTNSDYIIERLDLLSKLEGHQGCVNTVLFSECGEYVYTGSDDTCINIYHLHTGVREKNIRTTHTNNIFWAKDLPFSNGKKIVSCAADGRVILTSIDSETPNGKLLFHHKARAHRLELIPGSGDCFYSCGEDGICNLYDLRIHTPVVSTAVFKNHNKKTIGIYALGSNPFKNYEVILGGESEYAQFFDFRSPKIPVGFLAPPSALNNTSQATGVRINYSGESVLLSYNDDDIYLLCIQKNLCSTYQEAIKRKNDLEITIRNKNQKESEFESEEKSTNLNLNDDSEEDETTLCPSCSSLINNMPESGVLQNYNGHRNSDTVKQVNFYGQRSEYVVSGSDCGHIFIWSTSTGELVNLLKGDRIGAINCLTPHPHLPILATGGLENNAKIWSCIGPYRSLKVKGSSHYKYVHKVIKKNEIAKRESFSHMASPESFIRMLALAFQSGSGGEGDEDGDPSRRIFTDELRNILNQFGVAPRSQSDGFDEEEDEEENEEEDDDDDDDDDDDAPGIHGGHGDYNEYSTSDYDISDQSSDADDDDDDDDDNDTDMPQLLVYESSSSDNDDGNGDYNDNGRGHDVSSDQAESI